MTPHCQPLRKRYCTRCAKECVQFLIAAFDLICFLRPLPLCGGVTKASAFGDTAFLREKAVRKRARGKPLDPNIVNPCENGTARAAQRSACSFLLRLSI